MAIIDSITGFKMRLFSSGLAALLIGFSVNSMAETNTQTNSDVEQQLVDKLQRSVPGIPIVGIEKSELEGFYEIILGNGERVFARPGMNYFLAGNLFQAQEQGLVNLTEQKRDKRRADLLASVDAADKITFTPETKKVSVTVFTDVDCGYCQKLHREMDNYLAAGIEINYMAYPRAGVGSSSYNKIVNAWCAEDKQTAMTRLKSGQRVDSAKCENPVAEQFQMARQLGITGTPAIITQEGRIIPGYRAAAELSQLLGL